MAKASPIQNKFTAGELTPLLLGRQDIEKYNAGLATCLNMLPYVQGGLTRRPGSVFLKTVKFPAKTTRLVPFKYNTTQQYVLEFGDLYIRFFTLQGILTETAQTIGGITQADPGVITITGHGYSDGDRLHLSEMTDAGMHQLESVEVEVANKTANTFEIKDVYGNNIDTSGFDAHTSGGKAGKIIEVVTPYEDTDVEGLDWTQDANDLYLFHADYAPRKLVRNSATSWTLSKEIFNDGPYLPLNETATTLNPGASSGTGVSLAASSTTGINGGDGFKSTDVDRLVRLQHGSTWGHAVITGFTDTTNVTIDIIDNFGAATAVDTWRLGLFSDTDGWPVSGAFAEDRLVVGGAGASPQRVDGGRTGVPTDFSPTDSDGTVTDSHAITRTLNAEDVNVIRWIRDDEKGILIGTTGGEWVMRPDTLGGVLTPTNVQAKKSTSFGSFGGLFRPERVEDAILFIGRDGRKVHEFAFVLEKDGFRGPDLTLLSEHITSPQIDEIQYQASPQSIVWAQRTDGVLLGMTYRRAQDVVAWHRHEIAGTGVDNASYAEVESLAVINAPSNDREELWMIVTREINGQDTRYVELMSKVWETTDQQEDAVFLDSSVTEVSASPLTEITGLWNHEGETFQVYVDGALHPARTVTNGKITLDSGVTGLTVTVGYGYNSDAETMPIEAGAADGTAQGKIKRITRLGFWLLDTLGLQYGPDSDNLSEILFRNWGGDWGVATPLFTGVTRERFEGDYDRLGQIYLRAGPGGLPTSVLALMPTVVTEDDS